MNKPELQSLLASVLHDIRSPLNVIMVAAQVVCDEKIRPERRERNARLLNEAALSINSMCQDVLDYSKLSAGQMELSRITFHVRECVCQLAEGVRLLAQKKGLELRTLVAPDVPHYVVGDPGRLRQVLGNLLSNAVKFTPRGVVELRVQCTEDPDSLYFEVEDSGLGIAPDKLPTLFDPFRQAHGQLSTDLGGAGLGLAIARHLVQCMGGELAVSSQLGRGTCFKFRARFQPGEARETPRSEQLSCRRILIWDDHPDSREDLESHCLALGMHVVVAGSGPQAVQWLQEAYHKNCPFPLMLFNLNSGGGDALFTLEQIHPDHRQPTRFLAYNPTGVRGEMASCQEAGVQGYLSGNLDRAVLAEMLASLLSLDSQAEPLTQHTLRLTPAAA